MLSASRKTLWLSYFTAGYNIIEGFASVGIGVLTGSISLVGFGLDSFIESLSAVILIWRFRKSAVVAQNDTDPLETKAIKLIAYTFFILATYVLYESLKKLFQHEPPQQSFVGLIIPTVSIVVMVFLYWKKKEVGYTNHIRSLVADSKQTLVCIWMSIVLLISIGAYNLLGIWWTDAVGGIIIAGFLFKEGYSTYKEKRLCDC